MHSRRVVVLFFLHTRTGGLVEQFSGWSFIIGETFMRCYLKKIYDFIQLMVNLIKKKEFFVSVYFRKKYSQITI